MAEPLSPSSLPTYALISAKAAWFAQTLGADPTTVLYEKVPIANLEESQVSWQKVALGWHAEVTLEEEISGRLSCNRIIERKLVAQKVLTNVETIYRLHTVFSVQLWRYDEKKGLTDFR